MGRKKSNIIWKQAEDPEREVDVETLLAGDLDENLNSLACLDTQSLTSLGTLTTACSSSPSPALPTMDLIQDHLRLLMEGRPYEELHEFCDFSLQDRMRQQRQKELSHWLQRTSSRL